MYILIFQSPWEPWRPVSLLSWLVKAAHGEHSRRYGHMAAKGCSIRLNWRCSPKNKKQHGPKWDHDWIARQNRLGQFGDVAAMLPSFGNITRDLIWDYQDRTIILLPFPEEEGGPKCFRRSSKYVLMYTLCCNLPRDLLSMTVCYTRLFGCRFRFSTLVSRGFCSNIQIPKMKFKYQWHTSLKT